MQSPPDSPGPREPDDRALERYEAGLRARRWQLFRDLAVFQGKLLIDGLKDLVLGPVSLIAALLDLMTNREDPGRSFYQVLRAGRDFDRWVDLFGERRQAALPAAPGEPEASTPADGPEPSAAPGSLDAYVSRVERMLREQVSRGGLTAKTKDAIDKALDSLDRRGQ